ncbi:Sec63 Brl domain-containing protein [Dichotomocladium elegans]|nr:Sec63 Brl domain-containing protein [Dichotomocladium elegans]
MSSVSFLNCGFLFCLQSNTMWEPERPKKKLKSQYSPYEMPSYTPLPSSLLEHNSDSLQEANNESLLSDISDNGDISQWLDEEEALMDQRLDHMPVGNEGVPQQASLNQPATSLTTPEEVVKYMQHSVLSPDCTPEIRRDYQLQQQWSVVPTDSSGDLRSTMEIAMPYRNIFNFVEFNALQSECLDHAYHTNENLVISAPTGSGKTCIIEMAIVHTLSIASKKDVKIIYMAPTKSLCSERARDWEIKFQPLGATCKEYTGDTDFATAHAIKSTTIVITTPEKWDSMTRRWRDHIQLMSMVKLFIIDEVHILNEDRGAVLESCVSRMKTMDHHIRFVAISATIPNVNDIAEWLNAEALSFSEAYRPVKLNRIVYGYTFKGDNMFAFEKMLDWKLLDVIKKHSKDKPVLIFCSTRKSAQSSCEILLKMAKKQGIECFSQEPENSAVLKDKKLQEFVKQGIGYHHAGLDVQDRTTIESLFLNRSIRVVATTSTLAVGVNLPTYLVIIKSTKCYQNGNLVEYSDIEILQMIGRAGRPGFESSGCAVIMTTPAMKNHYTNLVGGIAPIESRLHENLVEHMMSEICLSSITDEESQAKWLRSTFLHVRVRVNPSHYHISSLGNTRFFGPDEILQDISTKHLNDLIDANLVEKKQLQRNSKERYIPTFYGDAMAKYYIKFKTMKNIVESTHCSSIQDILYIVSKAEEFSSMRFAAGEKPFLNSLQKNPNIRYPINGKVTTTADKVFLVIQCVLGDVSLHGGAMGNSLALASFQILQHARRITKCIIDCSIHEKDAIKLKHALEFHRCLSAKMWGNSSHILRQVERIGPRMAKNLLNAGISTFEQLRKVDSSRIEVILHRNPPFGSQIKETVDMIPHFALEFQQVGKRKQARNVTLQLEVSVLNEKSFQRVKFGKGYYAQIWIEMDKHALVDFRRIS